MRTPVGTFERAMAAFVLVAAVLVVFALTIVAQRRDIADFFRPDVALFVLASDGQGVTPGSAVRLKGIEIGSVQRVELVTDAKHPGKDVRLTLGLRPKNMDFLGEATQATINVPPFGAASVELVSDGPGRLDEKATLVARDEESLSDALTRAARDLSALSSQLGQGIGEIQAILTNVHKVTDSIAEGRGLAGRVLSDSRAADDLSASMANVRAATTEVTAAAGNLDKVSQESLALLREIRAMSHDVKVVFDEIEPVKDKIPQLLASIERTVKSTEALMIDLRSAAGYAPGLARKADVSLAETNRLIEGVQQNFIVRGSMPDRPYTKSESVLRPMFALPDGGAP